MKLKVDENLPVEAASILHQHGFEADTVPDESLSGVDDEAIANRVRAESRIFVTLDLDFSNIGAYPPDEYAGIIVLRLKAQDKPTVLSYINGSPGHSRNVTLKASCGSCSMTAFDTGKVYEHANRPGSWQSSCIQA